MSELSEQPTIPLGGSEKPLGSHSPNPPARWIDCLESSPTHTTTPTGEDLSIGIIRGEGVGPEVIDATMTVAQAVAEAVGRSLRVESCDLVRQPFRGTAGKFDDLPSGVPEFCRQTFDNNGAVLCGPGGGRFVYELRRELQLFFKISPLRAATASLDSSVLRKETIKGLDMLIVRENCGGVYQGDWNEIEIDGDRLATQKFGYKESQVREFLTAAARLAKSRRGHLTVVWKESGVPSISGLWSDCIEGIAKEIGISYNMIDADLMSYRLVREPTAFDVVAAPNLFGDILADLGAVLVGSRGSTFSGNFDKTGNGIYQTNHGAAFDLEGKQIANPTGQIFSYAMMLRESFGIDREATAIETAVTRVWEKGYLTADMQCCGSRPSSTGEMAQLIADEAVTFLEENERDTAKPTNLDATAPCPG